MKLRPYFSNHPFECGTDEAGRGCLAGPVTAGAVIFPKSFTNLIINDSKTLSASKRTSMREIIEENALAFSYHHIWPEQIDQINILNASILAMHKSISQLSIKPDFIAVDGNRFKPFDDIAFETIIQGDAKFLNIAAASILAKTYRDDYMNQIHEEYPMYNWKQNKGYPTREHRQAIIKYGITKYHRRSFRLLPEPIDLEL